jgi:hypothetical protein
MDTSTQALRDELDAALADLENASSLAEINQTLVDMLEVMKAAKDKAAPITVQVHPTPIHNTVQVPAAPTHDFRFDFDYDASGRLVSSRMTRIAPKKAS